jgi:hypothetical protein
VRELRHRAAKLTSDEQDLERINNDFAHSLTHPLHTGRQKHGADNNCFYLFPSALPSLARFDETLLQSFKIL